MRPGPELEDFFRDETQLFYCLQSWLINTNLAGLSISSFESNTLLRYTKCPFLLLIMSVLNPTPKKASPQMALSAGQYWKP